MIASTEFGSCDEGSLQAVQQDAQTPEKSTMAQGAATETPEKPSKGRKHGQKDYSFEERLRLLDWAIDSSIIARDRDFWVNKNPGGPRTFNIPWQSQQPHVSVDILLDWARAADIQQWREMIKEMPKLDWGKRSRIPNRWREKLDAGMSRLGQPALLTKHPDLLPALESVDELHKRERDLKEPTSAKSFHETLQAEVGVRRSEGDSVPAKVSRSWLQLRLKDLKAPEVLHPCVEANTVSEEDDIAYKQGLQEKLNQILRLQLSWDEFSCMLDQS